MQKTMYIPYVRKELRGRVFVRESWSFEKPKSEHLIRKSAFKFGHKKNIYFSVRKLSNGTIGVIDAETGILYGYIREIPCQTLKLQSMSKVW